MFSLMDHMRIFEQDCKRSDNTGNAPVRNTRDHKVIGCCGCDNAAMARTITVRR